MPAATVSLMTQGALAGHAARLVARHLDDLPPTRPADASGVEPRTPRVDEPTADVDPGIARGQLFEVPSPP
jgi:hypothetical protein